MFAIDVLTSLRILIRSSLMVHEKTSNAQGAFFEVPAKHEDQKSILFGRVESEPMARESSEDNTESPQFSHYRPNACCLKIAEDKASNACLIPTWGSHFYTNTSVTLH